MDIYGIRYIVYPYVPSFYHIPSRSAKRESLRSCQIEKEEVSHGEEKEEASRESE